MTNRSRLTGLLPGLLAGLLVASCGSTTPTTSPTTPPATLTPGPTATATPSSAPSPSASAEAFVCDDTVTGPPPASMDPGGPEAALFADIETQVVEIRGLTPTGPVARGVLDARGLCAFLIRSFDEKVPPELLAATEALYRELQLIPAGSSLEKLYLDMMGGQVIGLYDDKSKSMYVVLRGGALGPLDRITYAHEYDHALQDQAFGLTELVGKARDQGDRSLARRAVAEGDASLVMGLWAQQHLTSAELGEAVAPDPAAEAALARAPAILKEPLLFAYTSGLGLAIGAWQASGGFAGVDALFTTPPDTTEQVLHPEKLAAREAPVKVTIPPDLAERLGAGWTVPLQDTFGELQLEILLREGGGSDTKAAAAGWGGDRVALVEGPAGAVGVVLDTAWDTEADASEFATALEPLVAKLQAAGRSAAVLVPGPGRVVLVSGSSPEVLGRLANVLGLAQ